LKKVRIATILGTLQSRFTKFPFLDPKWKQNCDEERLLGVSLTGICDNEFFSTFSAPLAASLSHLRAEAIRINIKYADRLGINRSTAITCVKPSGTVSQLVDCASGIHPRWSPYYIRRVRIDKKDPMYTFLKEQGVECEDELLHPQDTAVFAFPMQAPPQAKLREHMTAVDQLQLALLYQDRWCEHKTSCTVYVREYEWTVVGEWVWKHFDLLSGISFLPYDNGSYRQAPYEEILKTQWEIKQAAAPVVEWNKLVEYDRQHLGLFARGKFVFACTGDNCEIVDIV
jgi:ribonucleoside-diphosphate reductase alpha chain